MKFIPLFTRIRDMTSLSKTFAVLLLSLGFIPEMCLAQAPPPLLLEGSKAKLVGSGVGNQEGYVRNWNGLESGAEWSMEVPVAGRYYLYFLAASPKGEGGIANLLLDGKKVFEWEIPSTKDFNDFQIVRSGALDLPAGKHTLSILSSKLNKSYLMDIKKGFLVSEDNPALITQWEEEQKAKLTAFLNGTKSFGETLLGVQNLKSSSPSEEANKIINDTLQNKYAHQMTWLEQDTDEKVRDFLNSPLSPDSLKPLVERVMKSLPENSPLRAEQKQLLSQNDTTAGQWLALYEKAAWERRDIRLDRVRKLAPELIFAKHHVFASVSGIYLITETEGSNKPSALCTLNLKEDGKGKFAQEKILYDPGEGMVRDPEISFDGKRLLFAMRPTKENFNSTYSREAYGIPRMNYQIYEMNLDNKEMRPLTSTETYGSSFEPCYLPNGDIAFSSARVVQHITCGWGDHSNLFIMNKDGKYARRVGYDQTNTAFPTLLNDGRVIFTRRDYNDRGQSAAHALFQMNSDGSNQTAFYGNLTGTPNSFHHARAIPNSQKVITIIGGYHTTQGGKLAIMDVKHGTEKDQGILQLPGYTKPASGDNYNDTYGKQGTQYSNPYALTEKDYIVSIAPNNHSEYALYYLNDIGERELLAKDPATSCLQAIPKRSRPLPPSRPSALDYTKDEGTFYVQNVYFGPAAEGIKPGSIKKMRVIAIQFKPATIGTSQGEGPGGCWDTVIPTGHGLASFDSKAIIGDATVYEDGSAMFTAPARKPVYFQLLDENNRVVQTMRSWATLMPNERFSCIGCHEDKMTAPLNPSHKTIALTKGAEKLQPFYGYPRAFSFIQEVQPIFDKHCISCHKEEGEAKHLVLTAQPYKDDTIAKKRFYRSYYELTNARPENGHKPEEFGFHPGNKIWGHRKKGVRDADEPNKYVSWYTRFELMYLYPPYRAGSIRSGLVKTLEKGHKNLKLSQEELDKIRAWIDLNIPFAGEYDESNLWTDEEKKLYRNRMNERQRNELIEARNIREMIKDSAK